MFRTIEKCSELTFDKKSYCEYFIKKVPDKWSIHGEEARQSSTLSTQCYS